MSSTSDSSGSDSSPRIGQTVTVLGRDGGRREETRDVVGERLLAIRLIDGDTFALMCSPGDEVELALGFLRAEGWIETLADVEVAERCDGGDSVRVRLRRRPDQPPAARRNLVMYASCGMCGREDALPYLTALEPLPSQPGFPAGACFAAAGSVRDRQPLFRATGGSHAAAIFAPTGKIVVVAEDVGRHAAFDKAVGRALRDGLETGGLGGFLSGRASLEMVAKAVRSRLAVLACVGAPTDAAIDLAERLGLALAGFVRDDAMTLYARAERIEG